MAAHRSNRASASSVSRSASALAADERRQLVEDARDLLGLGDLRLAPGVAQLDRDERLDEQRLAAARRVVDDALDPAPRLGLDGHDVAPVAERDDRLLERAAELRADERVEPPPQAVVGDPDRGPQPAEPRRGGVEQLADRIEAARQRRAEGRQRVELRARARAAAAAARRRGTSPGAPSRRASRRSRGTATARAGRRGPRARSPARCRAPPPMPDPRALLEQAARLVGLVELARDDDRIARRLERLGEPPRRRERRVRRQPGADRGNSSRTERARVHERCRLSRPETGRTATGDRARRTATGAPPTARRRRRSRSAAWPRSSGGASSEAAVSSRSGDAGSHRSSPVQPVSSPNAAATRPGPLASRSAGQALDAGCRPAAASAARLAASRRRAQHAVEAHRLDAVERLDGADEHGGRRAGRLGHHVEAVVHPVDKVHVGQARRPEHDPVACGLAEPGVRRPVVLADVRLDLDDPADAPPGRVVADQPRADQRARRRRASGRRGPRDR